MTQYKLPVSVQYMQQVPPEQNVFVELTPHYPQSWPKGIRLPTGMMGNQGGSPPPFQPGANGSVESSHIVLLYPGGQQFAVTKLQDLYQALRVDYTVYKSASANSGEQTYYVAFKDEKAPYILSISVLPSTNAGPRGDLTPVSVRLDRFVNDARFQEFQQKLLKTAKTMTQYVRQHAGGEQPGGGLKGPSTSDR